MLRIVFHCPSDQKLRTVFEGLSVLAERLRRPSDHAFTLYNVTTTSSGQNGASAVEMVEIHNDDENVFNCALDQVRLHVPVLPSWWPPMAVNARKAQVLSFSRVELT
jgi:hypothetical protein